MLSYKIERIFIFTMFISFLNIHTYTRPAFRMGTSLKMQLNFCGEELQLQWRPGINGGPQTRRKSVSYQYKCQVRVFMFLIDLCEQGFLRVRPLVAVSVGPYGATIAGGGEYHGVYLEVIFNCFV